MQAIRVLVLLAALAPMAAKACPPVGFDAESLATLKTGGFVVTDGARQLLALGLADCLADPDPAIRDGIAYEALTTWLRGDALDAGTRTSLLETLLPWIAAGADGDADGFRAPFAALVLSEVARTDRIAAWMTPEQRGQLLSAATAYVASVSDYRGFDAEGGWRHGVAHGADLLMQLALNPALDDAQRLRILDAVAAQVAPDGEHFYVYGEPERLSRPVLFVLAGKSVDAATWKAWLGKVAAPAPLASWRDAYGSQAGLAKRHNTRAFLLALYAGTLGSDEPAMQAFSAAVAEVLRTTG
jgi:hypothetical protein